MGARALVLETVNKTSWCLPSHEGICFHNFCNFCRHHPNHPNVSGKSLTVVLLYHPLLFPDSLRTILDMATQMQHTPLGDTTIQGTILKQC